MADPHGQFLYRRELEGRRFKTTKRVDDMALLGPITRQAVKDIIADAAKDGIKLMA
jgi:hypothetical protein